MLFSVLLSDILYSAGHRIEKILNYNVCSPHRLCRLHDENCNNNHDLTACPWLGNYLIKQPMAALHCSRDTIVALIRYQRFQ